MTAAEEIRLVIPAEEDFRRIVHLVTGGLASRLDVTYDDLEDIQVAVDAVLALREDEGDVTVVLAAEPGVLRAAIGPFEPDALQPGDTDGGLDLQRVLETVCDTHEFESREDGAWVELMKRTMAGNTGGEAAGVRPEDPASGGGTVGAA
jgi:anti-sigma regulatory factor (Ser/Thr protein kinase)